MWYLYALVQNPHLNNRRFELLLNDMWIVIEYSIIICSISSTKFISFLYFLKWFLAILRLRLLNFGEFGYAQLFLKMYRKKNTLRLRQMCQLCSILKWFVFYCNWSSYKYCYLPEKKLCSKPTAVPAFKRISLIRLNFRGFWFDCFIFTIIGLSDDIITRFQCKIFLNFQKCHILFVILCLLRSKWKSKKLPQDQRKVKTMNEAYSMWHTCR